MSSVVHRLARDVGDSKTDNDARTSREDIFIEASLSGVPLTTVQLDAIIYCLSATTFKHFFLLGLFFREVEMCLACNFFFLTFSKKKFVFFAQLSKSRPSRCAHSDRVMIANRSRLQQRVVVSETEKVNKGLAWLRLRAERLGNFWSARELRKMCPRPTQPADDVI